MARTECDRQPEVLELAVAGGWPQRCHPELRVHVDACSDCSELAIVASAIAADREVVLSGIVVPTSGAMWWKAQRRARQEATAAATRAVTLAQLLSFAAAIVVAFGALRSLFAWTGWSGWLGRAAQLFGGAVTLPHLSVTAAVALATCLTLAPIALLIAVREE